MADPSKIDVVITVSDQYLNRLSEVAERLQSAGLHIQQQLSSAGIVTGDIKPDQMDQLSALEGVAVVEKSGTYQLPPPDSPIQ